MSYYSGNLIVTSRMDLADVLAVIDTYNYEALFSSLKATADPSVFEDVYDKLTIKGKVSLLENAVIDRVLGQETPLVDWLIERNRFMTFSFREPITELQKIFMEFSGRRRRPSSK